VSTLSREEKVTIKVILSKTAYAKLKAVAACEGKSMKQWLGEVAEHEIDKAWKEFLQRSSLGGES